jgi:nicotinamide mononucleotide adenylyltransferase
MSFYSESLSLEALEEVLVAITNCVKVASKFDGRLFGGFVRGVIVPRTFNAKARVHYKDVDLWFTNKEQAEAFTRSAGLVPVHVGSSCLRATEEFYKFGREQYHLVRDDVVLAWIDVVISPTIPVNDFNVNRLTVRYDESGIPIFESFGSEDVNTLMDAILHKKVEMLPDYLPIIRSNPFHYRRIKENYLDHR